MMAIVFKEQDRSGVFTGKTAQFCSEECAEEWEEQGLAFAHYVSEQEEVQSPVAQCAACLKWLKHIQNDRVVINLRIAGHIRRDQADPTASESLVEQVRVMDFHLPGTPEAEIQLRELTA